MPTSGLTGMGIQVPEDQAEPPIAGDRKISAGMQSALNAAAAAAAAHGLRPITADPSWTAPDSWGLAKDEPSSVAERDEQSSDEEEQSNSFAAETASPSISSASYVGSLQNGHRRSSLAVLSTMAQSATGANGRPGSGSAAAARPNSGNKRPSTAQSMGTLMGKGVNVSIRHCRCRSDLTKCLPVYNSNL